MSDKKKTYDTEYHKNNIRQLKLALNVKTDKDILIFLGRIPEGFQPYVKRLIREDMKYNGDYDRYLKDMRP